MLFLALRSSRRCACIRAGSIIGSVRALDHYHRKQCLHHRDRRFYWVHVHPRHLRKLWQQPVVFVYIYRHCDFITRGMAIRERLRWYQIRERWLVFEQQRIPDVRFRHDPFYIFFRWQCYIFGFQDLCTDAEPDGIPDAEPDGIPDAEPDAADAGPNAGPF